MAYPVLFASCMGSARNPKLKHLERCRKHHVRFVPAQPHSNVHFALETIGQTPINGLRHPPQRDSSGWYIWCGEEFPTSPQCFIALQTIHLADCCPEALRLPALSSASRRSGVLRAPDRDGAAIVWNALPSSFHRKPEPPFRRGPSPSSTGNSAARLTGHADVMAKPDGLLMEPVRRRIFLQ